MSPKLIAAGVVGLFFVVAIGCGNDGPTLVDAGGTVTYQGKPIAGAIVTFVPSQGPSATGKTNSDGNFALSTGDARGVVVGDAKVSISAYPPPDPSAGEEFREIPKDPKGQAELMERMMSISIRASVDDGGKATRSKSLIPLKYSEFTSSGLTAAVTDDRSKNHFVFDLE